MSSSKRLAPEMSSSSCPAPEVIAAFADGRLNGGERLAVIRHLNGCDDCYELVVEASRFSEEVEEEAVSGSGSREPWEWRHYAAGLTGLAAAAMLVVGFALGWFDAWLNPPAEAWLASRPPLPADDPLMRQALPIFHNMSPVAAPGRESHLAGVRGVGFKFAMAGPDDTVYVSDTSLRESLSGEDRSYAETGFAVMLGHEFSHLNRGEIGHAFAAQYQHYHGDLSQHDLRSLERKYSQARDKEARADKEGSFYAFAAGYDVPRWVARESLALSGENAADNFFSRMSASPLAALTSLSHPPPRDRTQELVRAYQRIAVQLEWLHAANRLYQASRFQEAVDLLQNLKGELPLPEVDNNLGAVHFQLAARNLAACNKALARRYLLPVAIDYRSIEQGSTPRGADDPCYRRSDFQSRVQAARRAFDDALEKDPRRLSTRINRMSLALLDASEEDLDLIDFGNDENDGGGQPSAAQPSGQDAPANVAEKMLSSLLKLEYFLDQGPDIAIAEESLEELRDLRRQHQDYPPLAYNLPAALDRAGSARDRLEWVQEAGRLWPEFLELRSKGPFAEHARQRLNLPSQDNSASDSDRIPTPPFPLTSPEALPLLQVEEIPLPLAETGSPMALYRSSSLRVLQSDSTLLWIEESANEVLDEEAVRSRYGEPLDVVPTSAGSFLRYRSFGADIVHGNLKATVWFSSD